VTPPRPASLPGHVRQGLVLIVVVGILGVLAVLATGFITMAQLERRASQQRIHATQALFLARSGIEDVLARITLGQDPQGRTERYRGEDWDADGTLAAEAMFETWRRGVLDVEECPLRFALRPSFPVLGTDPIRRRPVWIPQQEGPPKGYSGSLGPAGFYALKVEDESGKICVNGGFLDAADRDADGIPDHRDQDVTTPPPGTGRGWNRQLARILGCLGRRLSLPALGTLLMTNRPEGGYRTLAQVQAAAGTSVDLSPYLCLHAWTDVRVVRPNVRTSNFLAVNDLKKDRGPLSLEEGGRPPVNLNAAHPKVLESLLEGIQGKFHVNLSAAPERYTVSSRSAALVSAALVVRREESPWRTWGEFGAFLDSLASTAISGYYVPGQEPVCGDLGAADMLKANFDPNTLLEKQMPDGISWRWFDKSDLSIGSTEGSLGPTGIFRVESLGRVSSPSGRLLASASLSATVRAFDLLRQTSQKDFVSGRTPNGGDTSYLSLAALSPAPPFPLPRRTAGAEASWNTWNRGQGLAVLTYPCAIPAVNAGQAADFDGCIALATLECPHTPPALGNLRFLHHFDDGWEADLAVAGGTLQPGPAGTGGSLQRDPARSVWPPSGIEPSTLHPDGAYLQLGRSPAYLAANLPEDADATSDHGALSYWTKRNVLDAWGQADFCVARRRLQAGRANLQSLLIGSVGPGYLSPHGLGILLESWARDTNSTDAYHERACRQGFQRCHQQNLWGSNRDYPLVPALRWQLVGAFYDDDQTLVGRTSTHASWGWWRVPWSSISRSSPSTPPAGRSSPPIPPMSSSWAWSGAFSTTRWG